LQLARALSSGSTQRLIGIVSGHDFLVFLEKGQNWGELCAKDIMTPNPYSVRPDTDLSTLVHVLPASNLIRVPVVVADDKLVGIVARRDILLAYFNYGVEAPPVEWYGRPSPVCEIYAVSHINVGSV
jgi:CBS-domain-containing membrane protein